MTPSLIHRCTFKLAPSDAHAASLARRRCRRSGDEAHLEGDRDLVLQGAREWGFLTEDVEGGSKTFGAGASFSQEMRLHRRPTAYRHGSRLVPHPAGLAEGGLSEAAAESQRRPLGVECRT